MVLYARDIVESDYITLDTRTSALEAARIMKERRHGFVIVTNGGVPSGIVTEWDYLSKIVANDRSAKEANLGEIMSENLVTVQSNEGIDHISKLMVEKGIRRVLVLDKGKLVGVITSKTILMRLEEYINVVSAQIARLQAPF